MTKIVYNGTHWLEFNRFMRGMEIVSSFEPVSSPLIASEFDTEAGAQYMINEIEKGGIYDTSAFVIQDKDEVIKQQEAEKEQEAKALAKTAWDNTSTEKKSEMIKDILDAQGPDALKEWLDYVGDTTTEGE